MTGFMTVDPNHKCNLVYLQIIIYMHMNSLSISNVFSRITIVNSTRYYETSCNISIVLFTHCSVKYN